MRRGVTVLVLLGAALAGCGAGTHGLTVSAQCERENRVLEARNAEIEAHNRPIDRGEQRGRVELLEVLKLCLRRE